MAQNPEVESSVYSFSDPVPEPRILPKPPVLASSTSSQLSLLLQVHNQPAWETPECCLAQHKILIHHAHSSARVERCLDGIRRNERFIAGDVVFSPATVRHQVVWSQEINYLILMLEPTYLEQVAIATLDRDRVELIPHFAQADPLIYQIGLALKTSLESNAPHWFTYAEAAANFLAVHLLQYYSSSPATIRLDGGLTQQQLQQVIDYIQAHLAEEISLATIAATIEISQYHFSRLFKQSMGIAPYQYVIQCRIEFAKQLLASPNLSIAQISDRLGYSSTNQFSYFFRRQTGFSPKKYRQKI